MGANHPQATSSWPRTVIPTSTAGIAGWRGKETTQRAEKWPVASGHLPDISLWSTHVLTCTGLNFVNPDMPHNTQERHCQRNTVCPCSVYFICALCLCAVCTECGAVDCSAVHSGHGTGLLSPKQSGMDRPSASECLKGEAAQDKQKQKQEGDMKPWGTKIWSC